MRKRLPPIDFLKSLLYNTFVYKNAEVYKVQNNYGFLFKKSSLPKSDLDKLLRFDDFIDEANKVLANGRGVEDIDIYNIAKSIYFPMLKNHQTDGFKETYKIENGAPKYKEWSFKFRIFGNAAKSFSKVLFGSTEHLMNDYLIYCNQ